MGLEDAACTRIVQKKKHATFPSQSLRGRATLATSMILWLSENRDGSACLRSQVLARGWHANFRPRWAIRQLCITGCLRRKYRQRIRYDPTSPASPACPHKRGIMCLRGRDTVQSRQLSARNMVTKTSPTEDTEDTARLSMYTWPLDPVRALWTMTRPMYDWKREQCSCVVVRQGRVAHQ